VITIQDAPLAAFHAHSRDTETVAVALPPEAANVELEAVTVG
jgi:hypothetical protein